MYFVLRNPSPKVNHVLMSVNFLAFFFSRRMLIILDPTVRDFKTLETCGNKLPISEDSVQGTVNQVTRDNLSMHTLLGFGHLAQTVLAGLI